MKLILPFLFLFSLAGCGTMFLNQTQAIRIHSATSLDDAEIKINGQVYDHKNGTIMVDKKADGLFITVKKPGYLEKSQYASRNIHPLALAGDIIILPGLVIDFITGGFYQYEPSEFSLTMRKKD